MRSILGPLAEEDLESIGDYIARDNPRRAVSFVRELRAQCLKIARSSQGYRRRPELGETMRSCAYGNYIIFFIEEEDVVRILRVLHGSMDIEAKFSENSNAN